ncbi:FAD-binding oxidoreductase [Tropicimonas sp. TH_r6]|uniref:FAD-binding oxidoreductase n=1 Tax=Tropicimonas sp. TH_r6 TaxID=3082085 RepID=UPI002953D0CD|nr:FAD-binding oxidoreductase [Tropicimonas sp. TH_r6]MDV7145287.1 FAD-binding oxidoreductase [Tropicimonas sp. TH_r6]
MTWKQTDYTGWGRYYTASGQLARPERAATLTRIATETPCPAFGQRRSYADACLNSDNRAIDTARLDRFLGFDAESGLLEVESGVRLSDIVTHFAPKGWLPSVLPGTGFATVGGAIGMDVHGKNHHHLGSFGQHVEGLTLATPDGPREITAEDPLFAATIGGMGQTGPIARATLRMLPVKGDVMMVTERRVPNLDSYFTHLDESQATYTVGWIDATAKGDALGRGIFEEGETGPGLVPPAKRGKSIPFNAPHFALSGPIVRNFNTAYYRRIPERGRTVVKPLEDYFFPLDKIHDWNRLYGKRGFHQFQCVVPLAEREILRDMLSRVSGAGLASPLAVLKRMGPGRGGMMSFPMEGYTLAIDFPARDEAAGMIRTLIAMAVEANGRVYLAKDGFAEPGQMDAMYPERAAWTGIVNALDPEQAYATDMIRRLSLRSQA